MQSSPSEPPEACHKPCGGGQRALWLHLSSLSDKGKSEFLRCSYHTKITVSAFCCHHGANCGNSNCSVGLSTVAARFTPPRAKASHQGEGCKLAQRFCLMRNPQLCSRLGTHSLALPEARQWVEWSFAANASSASHSPDSPEGKPDLELRSQQ